MVSITNVSHCIVGVYRALTISFCYNRSIAIQIEIKYNVCVNLDGVTDYQVTTGSGGTWSWKKPSVTFTLPAGTTILTIRVREDGAQVDKLFLATSSTTRTGLGGTALSPQYRE
jgi:hypothetical protein